MVTSRYHPDKPNGCGVYNATGSFQSRTSRHTSVKANHPASWCACPSSPCATFAAEFPALSGLPVDDRACCSSLAHYCHFCLNASDPRGKRSASVVFFCSFSVQQGLEVHVADRRGLKPDPEIRSLAFIECDCTSLSSAPIFSLLNMSNPIPPDFSACNSSDLVSCILITG